MNIYYIMYEENNNRVLFGYFETEDDVIQKCLYLWKNTDKNKRYNFQLYHETDSFIYSQPIEDVLFPSQLKYNPFSKYDC